MSHDTILQLSCCFVSHENWRHVHPCELRSRQHYAFNTLFPEIRDLPTMKGLLDLERQGYGFRAAKLCFKAQFSKDAHMSALQASALDERVGLYASTESQAQLDRQTLPTFDFRVVNLGNA